MQRYHIMRMSTWIMFVAIQICALFFNTFYMRYMMYDSLPITAGAQAVFLFVTGTMDTLGCYVVSTELINTVKKQRQN
jgi:hypothetical protein